MSLKDENVFYTCGDCGEDVPMEQQHQCDDATSTLDWEAQVIKFVEQAQSWDNPDTMNYGIERLLDYIVELTEESYARGYTNGYRKALE